MTRANCGWREEDLIDYALGKLAAEKHQELARHISQCAGCAADVLEWESMLQESGEELSPSPVVKKRLMRRVRLLGRLSVWRSRLRSLKSVPAAGACAILLLVGGLLIYDPAVPESPLAAEAKRMHQNELVNDPQTVLHQSETVMQSDAKGYVWINTASNEMLLLAEGLDRLTEKDYQVWLVIGNDRSNVGVLQWRGRMAHLYFHGTEVRQVDDIAVSIEPKGGSYTPTGPDAMIVKIRHGK